MDNDDAAAAATAASYPVQQGHRDIAVEPPHPVTREICGSASPMGSAPSASTIRDRGPGRPTVYDIHGPIREQEKAAAALLLSALSDGGSAPLERRRMPTRLTVRASSAPAPRVREAVVSVQ